MTDQARSNRWTRDFTVPGFISVGLGGAIGCWLRWSLSAWLNPAFPLLPLGTLAANWIAAFVIGCLVGMFIEFESLPVEVRLFATTGVMGGLSTFSTFSAEASKLLLAGNYAWFAIHVAGHLLGSLLLCVFGMYLMHQVFHFRYRSMDVPDPEK
jgi:CrcB protein